MYPKYWKYIFLLLLSGWGGIQLHAQCSTAWAYTRSILIDNTQNTTLSNYHVKLSIPSSLWISQGQLNSDGSDLRFLDDCSSLCSTSGGGLEYWIEDGPNGINQATTFVWVKIPTLPAGTAHEIVMFYGNPMATTPQSSISTFAVVGSDDSPNQSFNRGFTIAAEDPNLSFTEAARAVRWQIKSGETISGVSLKSTDSNYTVVGTSNSFSLVQGTNFLNPDNLFFPAGGHPGMYVSGAGTANLYFSNGQNIRQSAGNIASGGVLNSSSSSLNPCFKIWWRKAANTEPIVQLESQRTNQTFLSLTPDDPTIHLCDGNQVQLEGTAGFNRYDWNSGLGSTAQLTVNQSGTYTLTASKNKCVQATASVNVSVNPTPSPVVTPTDTVCEFRQAFTYSVANQSGFTYQWSVNGGTMTTPADQAQISVDWGARGLGELTVTAVDDNFPSQCVATVSQRIVVQAIPAPQIVRLSSDEVCENTGGHLYRGLTDLGDQYFWTVTNGTIEGPADTEQVSVRWDGTGAGELYLTVGHQSVGWVCDTTVADTIDIRAVPVANFSMDADSCFADTLTLASSATISKGSIVRYDWSLGNGDTRDLNAFSYAYPDTGRFVVSMIVTSEFGCKDTAIQTKAVKANPVVDLGADTSLCFYGSIVLNAGSEGAVYLWSDGSMEDSLLVEATGQYSVQVINGQFCETLDSIFVQVHPVFFAEAGLDQFINLNESIQLQGTGGDFYLWSPATSLDFADVADPRATPQETTTYTLVVSDAFGCTQEDAVTVNVNKAPALRIPNTFTPNGDGINDTWQVENLWSYPECEVNIFDRYGKQVFHSIGYQQAWNGRLLGAVLPPATYYYQLTPVPGAEPVVGFVSLLR